MSKFEFEPIKKNSLVIELTRRLLDYIFSGSIQPGEKLPTERQLQEALNVGRSSIREAIKVLNVLGILEVRQGDGTYLTKSDSGFLLESIEWGLLLGEKNVMDVIEARKEIEITVAKLAAERCTQEEIEELLVILEKLERSSINDFVELDVAFHLKLADMAKNSVFKNMLISIQSLLRTWIKLVINEAANTDFSYSDHLNIYLAVSKKDQHEAEAAMRAHMEDASKRLIEVIEKKGEGI
ncbi:FadR/GntR family transcriptional regulator [Metabacillus halosaccharovorans]|uniref:FadR/GntR family transcriptional regulator n=1 Tax=Metabacillus halosaccharovorans TaxID=930124 RepID=UPI0020400624|nr:FadR/GntR family transcriptional regulator [Metabacillus halosaccharovorans]MCM3439376.1 FadR family transcriptional regulator [Metabacillus halosaccharovorans]